MSTFNNNNRGDIYIVPLGHELGKSLCKILLSEKYKDIDYPDLFTILDIAHKKASELMFKELTKEDY